MNVRMPGMPGQPLEPLERKATILFKLPVEGGPDILVIRNTEGQRVTGYTLQTKNEDKDVYITLTPGTALAFARCLETDIQFTSK
jgi:hypothetical protein